MDCARRTAPNRDGRVSRFRVGSDKGSYAKASSAQHGTLSSTASRPVCHLRAREDANYPKSWAGIFADSQPDNVPKRVVTDATISASVASAAASVTAPRVQGPV